ncbi:MAG: hypothetical protein HY861_00945 [Chlamydiia bacterium]|nr:hypothetical protein [Chlamydiia bacterium]
MASYITEALDLIRAGNLLLEEEKTIFASPEDAAYFRSRASSTRHAASPSIPPFNPVPIPEPVARELQPPPAPLPVKVEALLQHIPLEKPPQPVQRAELPTPDKLPVGHLRALITKIAPGYPLVDHPPPDQIARQIANRWKTKNQSAPISVLSHGENPQHKALLEAITNALDISFDSARLIQAEPIEKEKQWEQFLSAENLKHIVICDATLWQLNHLRQFYKEVPAQGIRTLGAHPLFLLPDLSLYLKDPLLKRSLWKALCQTFSPKSS